MTCPRWIVLAALLLAGAAPAIGRAAEFSGRVWITTQDGDPRMAEAAPLDFQVRGDPPGEADEPAALIRVDSAATFQTMLGLGSSLEPTTCFNLARLDEARRDEALTRLFDPVAGIGMNLMRLCIGTPDFTGDPWYTYDDVPPGQTDAELRHFSIANDRRYILPIARQALAKNRDLLFFASPWSPPGWMKSTGDMIGGRLLPDHYAAYAEYFCRFIQAYRDEGIPIHAVTVQNEPGVDRQRAKNKWRYPSCRFAAEEERDFIRDHLGPALRRHGLATKIWCYDHNFNVAPTADGDDPGVAYPRAILSDPAAAQYVSGVAWHGYAGQPGGMSQLLREFPGKPAHFTEGSVFGLGGARRLASLLAAGASSYNAWVTMIDDQGQPNNGPFRASRTCIMLRTADLSVDYTTDYYFYGQFMRFIERGAARIEVTASAADLAPVAFRNPDGRLALIVVNPRGEECPLRVAAGDAQARYRLPARCVATFVWRPE